MQMLLAFGKGLFQFFTWGRGIFDQIPQTLVFFCRQDQTMPIVIVFDHRFRFLQGRLNQKLVKGRPRKRSRIRSDNCKVAL
jgi:hypothetical protein